eukprot:jgi/Botrbrau1/1001/Bobra.114_1s0039.1
MIVRSRATPGARGLSSPSVRRLARPVCNPLHCRVPLRTQIRQNGLLLDTSITLGMPVVMLDFLSQVGLVEASAVIAAAGATLGFILGANSRHLLSQSPPEEDLKKCKQQKNSSAPNSHSHEWDSSPHHESGSASSASHARAVIAGSGKLQVQGLTAEGIWEAAWRPLEQGPAETVAEAHPSHTREGGPRDNGEEEKGMKLSTRQHKIEGRLLRRPTLALQGIHPKARRALLAISLATLERHILRLPDQALRASGKEWEALLPALLSSCSVAAAQAWLGYTPPTLGEDADRAFRRIASDVGVQAEEGSSAQTREPATSAPAPDTSSQPETPGTLSSASAVTDMTSSTSTSTSAWGDLADRRHLHAVVARYLRFGHAPLPLVAPRGASGYRPPVILPSTEERLGTLEPSGPAGGDGPPQEWKCSAREKAAQLLDLNATGVRGWDSRSPEELGFVRANSEKSQVSAPVLKVAPELLQDMAVSIANAVAEAYLAEAGVGLDGGPARAARRTLEPGSWPTYLHHRLTNTRALERFRNQVALTNWMEGRWGSVAAIYEDRHEVWGIGPGGQILRRSLPGRRAAELESLQGWRYLLSLILEALDVATPLVSAMLARAGAALSWLLVTFIGRSLGLVYRGVRQSLGGSGRQKGSPSDRPPQAPRQHSAAW